jgi:hypothetical protein
MMDKCWLHNSVRRISRGEWHSQRCGMKASFNELVQEFVVSANELVTGLIEGLLRHAREFLLHQNVIGIKS